MRVTSTPGGEETSIVVQVHNLGYGIVKAVREDGTICVALDSGNIVTVTTEQLPHTDITALPQWQWQGGWQS